MASAQDIINDARSYASSLKSDATSSLTSSMNMLNIDISAAYNSVGKTPFAINGITKLPEPPTTEGPPAIATHELSIPTAPGEMPSTDAIPTYTQQDVPTFTDPVPTFEAPNKPNQLEAFGEQPPSVDTSIDFPLPPPELQNPYIEPVVFDTHTPPTKVTVSAPRAPNPVPANDAIQPTDLDDRFSTNYAGNRTTLTTLAESYVADMVSRYAPQHHASMAKVEARLQTCLDGGTGLKPDVEDAIYSRGRAKNDVETRRVQDAAFADTAARGFTLPSGALTSMLARARQDAANNNNKTSNEIMIAQAELEQKNLQFAVTTSVALRTAVIQMTHQWLQGLVALNGQALDAAKAIMSAYIEAYNTAIKAYSVKVEAWKAEVSAIEALTRVELSKVELYKAEVSALQAEYTVDQLKVERYKADISKLMSLAELYKGQVNAVMGQVTLEKMKIEIFQAQVQAYTAQVQQKEAEWRGFSSEVSGFSSEAQAYSARVSGYSAQVQGFKAGIDAKVAEMNAVIGKNQGTVEGYKAAVAGYLANVQAESASNTAKNENERYKGTLYKIQVDANVSKYNQNVVYYKAEADRILEEAKQKFGASVQAAKILMDGLGVVGPIYSQMGNVSGQMAQAALAGMNSLAASTETI